MSYLPVRKTPENDLYHITSHSMDIVLAFLLTSVAFSLPLQSGIVS